MPAALRLLTALPVDRRRSLAWWSASGAAAGAGGLLLGGLVTQWASWRAIFWFTLVLAGVLVLVVLRTVPVEVGDRSPLDVLGAVLLTGAVMAWVVGAALLEFPRWRLAGVGLVAVGVLLVPALVAVERRHRAPLLPGPAVRNPHLRAGAIGSFLNTATTTSAVTLVTLHLQGIDRVSAAAAGLLLLPFSLGVVAGAAVSGPLVRRPPLALATGLGLVAVGILALVPFDGAAVAVPFCLAVSGAGLGLSSVAANATGTDVPADLGGVAAGVLNTAAQVGTAIGVAAILLVAVVSGSGGPATGAGAGWIAAGAPALLGVGYFARRRSPAPIPG